MNTPEFDTWLRALLANPSIRYAVRQRIEADSTRDPVDALHDAEILLEVARNRLESIQGAHGAPERD